MKHESIDARKRGQWLAAREQHVTSTEVANLFGVGWESHLMYWHHKHPNGKLRNEVRFVHSERSAMGKIFERSIADAAKSREPAIGLGWKMRKDYAYRYNQDLKIGASYDYIIDEGFAEGENGVSINVDGWGCEIKNIDYGIWADQWVLVDDEDEGIKVFQPPAKYEFQGHQQRLLDERPGTVFLVCVGGNRLETIPVPYKPMIGEALVNVAKDFWESENPPDPDYEKDADVIRKLLGNATDHSILDARTAKELQVIRDLAQRHYDLGQAVKVLKTEKKAATAQILDIAQQHSQVWLPNNGKIDLGRTKGTAPKVITEDMVGQEYGGRAGFRRCRVYPGKPEEEKPKKPRKKAATKKGDK